MVGRESVQDNPYLDDFYADMPQWIFNLAVYNLTDRIQHHEELKRSDKNVIIDRSIYEDMYVFITALHEMGAISERDYQTYASLWKLLVDRIPKPDALIYLHAPVETLISRIRRRRRASETNITISYLQLLEDNYSAWIKEFDLCPVISIDASEFNFLAEPDVVESAVAALENAIGPLSA